MARLHYNGVSGTLGASLSNSATTVTLAAALTHSGGTNVPTISAPDVLPLSILDTSNRLTEVVYVTAYTSGATTATITRGQEGTTGVSHASGDPYTHALVASDTTPIALVTPAADTVPYFTGSAAATTTAFTSFARTLVDDASATAARTTLGLGTSATVNTGTTSGTIPLLGTGGLMPAAQLGTGTANNTTYLRGDGTWATPSGGGSTGTAPNGITGLVAWYKADAITGKTNGQAISQWDDSSGNTRHLTQATAGKQPTYVTTDSLFGGLPCVRFAGTDDTLTNTAVTGISAVSGMTVIVVGKLTANGTHDLMHLDNGAGISVVRLSYESAEWQAGGGGAQASGNGQVGRGAAIRMAHYDGTTATVLQGTSALSNATGSGSVTTTRIFMGSYRDSANYLTGEIAEVCVWNKALSASERLAVVQHLANKYQLGLAA